MAQANFSLQVSGTLCEADVQRLTKTARDASGVFGPTTLYYAGVTAPAISAAMGFLTRVVLSDSQMFSAYWTNLLSAFVAALAGIAWYTIFVRWSKRSRPGRASDLDTVVSIAAEPDHLVIRRNHVETKVQWQAVREVKPVKAATVVFLDGASPFIMPDTWFDGTDVSKTSFMETLRQKAADHAQART